MQATNKYDEPNYFGQLLGVLSDEELIRCRKRFELANEGRMAEILTDELEEREALERTQTGKSNA
jgi:hypothetical protein